MMNLIFIDLLNPLMTGSIESTFSDEEIIEQYLASHDMKLYSVLYDRYSGKVYGKCISLLKNEDLAEDATQEIFIKILLSLAKFSGKSKFSTWIYSITYNFCIDVIRRKKKDPSYLVEDIGQRYDIVEEVEDRFILETNVKRLKKVLEILPLSDKTILIMKYQDNLSIKEIGGIITKTESAVKMKIKRAKEKFKTVYYDLYKDIEI